MNKLSATCVWKGYTSKMEAVLIIRHDTTGEGFNWGIGKWEVNSDLYESKYFPTKKEALKFAKGLIETFDRHRAGGGAA